jgi:integrase
MSAGHIRQRGRNSWELKYDAARDPITGKRAVKFKTVRGSKRDAQRELRKVLDAVESGTHADAGKLTLAKWLTTWMDGRRHSLSAKTAQEYDGLIAKHISPCIGHVLLRKVTSPTLNTFYADRLTKVCRRRRSCTWTGCYIVRSTTPFARNCFR